MHCVGALFQRIAELRNEVRTGSGSDLVNFFQLSHLTRSLPLPVLTLSAIFSPKSFSVDTRAAEWTGKTQISKSRGQRATALRTDSREFSMFGVESRR